MVAPNKRRQIPPPLPPDTKSNSKLHFSRHARLSAAAQDTSFNATF
jgi:hypothetical protein